MSVETAEDQQPATPGIDSLGISQVAELTGLTAHTLRYYERIGLLAVCRDHTGHRRYSANDVRRVIFITRLRHTDMPIRDIQRYFALVDAGRRTELARLELLLQHRESVQGRLATLESALDAIDFKIEMYRDAASFNTNGDLSRHG